MSDSSVISRSTLIPLGAVLVVGVFVVGGLISLSERLIRIEVQLEAVDDKVTIFTGNRWTRDDMMNWVDKLRLSNDAMSIPAIIPPR